MFIRMCVKSKSEYSLYLLHELHLTSSLLNYRAHGSLLMFACVSYSSDNVVSYSSDNVVLIRALSILLTHSLASSESDYIVIQLGAGARVSRSVKHRQVHRVAGACILAV